MLNIISTSNDLNKILEFANQSLITNEINKEKNYYDKTINEINEIISNKEKLLDTIRTDTSIINDYISKKKILSNCNNKQRKKLNREISILEENYKYIKDDFKIFESIEFYKMKLLKTLLSKKIQKII